ncbi:MAG: glycosyltransferase [Chloroflexia bacterium]|nr:glycosyltransferase [Chloroflexia bacterium]
MRVAMFSLHTCPFATLGGKNTGGMNVYVRELSRELGRRGIAVDVYTRSQNCHIPAVRWFGQNVRLIHVQAGPENGLDKNDLWQYTAAFADGVRRVAQEEGLHYDVLHSHYWLSALAALELRQNGWSTPIAHMFHTLAALKQEVEGFQEDPRRLRVEAEIVQQVDAIVAATPLDRQHMLDYYRAPAERIVVIPPGVNLDLFRPIPKQEARLHVGAPCEPCEETHMLLYVGRMDPMKGVDDLLRALPYLVQDLPDDWPCHICMALVGGDSDSSDESLRQEMDRLQDLKHELGIQDFATFLGRREQDELPYYYSAADVCIVPSHYESFGLVALESLACGTPVVASRVGGLTYIVEDGLSGFLVPRGNPPALAQRIGQLLADCGLRRHMGGHGQEMAQQYGWPSIAERVLELYEELIEG